MLWSVSSAAALYTRSRRDFAYLHCRLPGGVIRLCASQIDTASRGFSFAQDGPLDMRMGPSAQRSAEDIVNTWPEVDLGRIFREWGEERAWRRIAAKIVAVRFPSGAAAHLKGVGMPQRRTFGPRHLARQPDSHGVHNSSGQPGLIFLQWHKQSAAQWHPAARMRCDNAPDAMARRLYRGLSALRQGKVVACEWLSWCGGAFP
jgi:hypothetical protein